MTRNLRSIGFYDVKMNSIPNWIKTDQIQFLEFQSSISDNVDMSALDELPTLEHFLLTESSLTSIKSPFLSKSSKLISLTLQCNSISSIAAGAFDHFTELQFLNLAGNRIASLPSNLLLNLNNLIVLDLKALDNSSNTIGTYNELSMQCQINQKASTVPVILDKMPDVSKPEKLVALEIRGQENIMKNDKSFLKNFKNLEVFPIVEQSNFSIKKYYRF